MMKRASRFMAATIVLSVMAATPRQAVAVPISFSLEFNGTFTGVNDVQWFAVSNGTPSIDLWTILAANFGPGFDTQLFLFDTSLQLLAQNDDSLEPLSPLASYIPYTGVGLFESYYLALTSYDNNPILAGGVLTGWTGAGGAGYHASGDWTVRMNDLLDARLAGVGNVPGNVDVVPEPATLILLGSGLSAIAARRRMKKRA